MTTTDATTDATPDVSADATSVAASVHADNTTFADFGVRQEIVDALSDAGIVQPFPIQAMTLPVAMSGHDIIGQAKTGTGKTLGFGVPLLHRVVAPGEPGFDELPSPASRRRSSSSRRASSPSRSRTTSPRPRSAARCASSSSTAVAPTSRRSRR